MDDLDHLLAGLHRADYFLADGALAHLLDEILDHGQGDIGFQKRHADLAQRGIDVLFRQGTAPGQSVEYAAEAV